MQSTYSLIFIDGIPNTYHWRGGRGRRRRSRYQWCCKHTHWFEDLSTRLYHTIFPHCSVVTQEELEHRLLDQLSEGLQVSEAQLGGDGQKGKWCHHLCMLPLHVLHPCSCVVCSPPFPVTQFINLRSLGIFYFVNCCRNVKLRRARRESLRPGSRESRRE